MLARSMFRRSSIAVAALVLAACGGGGDSGTNPTPKGFTVALSASTLSVQQGATGSITATIGRTGDFSGTVNLSVEGLPTGITGSFSPSAITSGTTSTTLSVTAAASVAPGTYNFTIRGQATGLTDQTASVSLTVTAAPSIALTLAPTSASVAQGATTTYTATVARTNFAGAVAVAVTGAPTGVTTNITNAGDVSTVTVTVAASTATGTYTLATSATGTGVTAASANFALTVTAAPTSSIAIAAAPAAISVQAGGSAVPTTVTITRTAFTGAVVIAPQSGVPAGVTTTNNPSGPTLGNSVDVAFTAAASTTPGTYTVVLQGSGNGATSGTTQVALTVTAAAASSIALAASPPTLTATAGGAAVTSALTLTRTNFTGNVTFAATGAPNGMTASVAPATTTGTTATLTVTAGASTVAGTYPITVSATGTGVTAASAVVSVTVPAPSSSIVLSATPATLALQAGASGSSTINIARTNFTGAVALSASGAPSGVTLTLGSTSTTANSTSLTIAVGAATATGSYTITISGTGTGITAASTTIALTVAPASSGGNISWQFCGSSVPIWLAVQNGNASAPWTQVAAGPNNSYTFSITSLGAVAWVTQASASTYTLTVFYATSSEMGSTNQCGTPTTNNKTLTGTVTGFTGITDFVSVNFGGALNSSITQVAPNFTLSGAPDGTHDLLATRSTFNLTSQALVLSKLWMKRGLNPPNGTSLGTIDFNGADAFNPDTKQLTINGINSGEAVSLIGSFQTANGTFGQLTQVSSLTGNVTDIFTVPSAKLAAGDLHNYSITASVLSGSTLSSLRSITFYQRDPSSQTVTLGPVLNTPTVSVLSSAPYMRLRSVLAAQSEYSSSFTTMFLQASSGAGRVALLSTTTGYRGSNANVDVSIPDFTGVGGWQNTWGLQSGTSTTWTVLGTGFLLGNGQIIDGAVFRIGQRQGTITSGLSK